MKGSSKKIIVLIRKYRELYGKKPEPFWFDKDEDEYIKYLQKEIDKFNNGENK